MATIDDAVARFLREFREERGLTLTQISEAAKTYGAQWGAASVRAIERGESALTLEKLITLALALRLVSASEPFSLTDLLGDTERFKIGTGDRAFSVKREWLAGILNGAGVDPLAKGMLKPGLFNAAQWIARNAGEHDLPPNVTSEQIYVAVPTGAEKRAAKKAGISDLAIALWARHLWGHSLDEEARERAGENATPQARGRVTRILLDELLEARAGT